MLKNQISKKIKNLMTKKVKLQPVKKNNKQKNRNGKKIEETIMEEEKKEVRITKNSIKEKEDLMLKLVRK